MPLEDRGRRTICKPLIGIKYNNTVGAAMGVPGIVVPNNNLNINRNKTVFDQVQTLKVVQLHTEISLF